METEKILKIKEIYEEFLKIVEITKSCENKFKQDFNIEEKEKYRNPFRLDYDFEKVIDKVKKSVISQIITIFNEKYPNIDLDSKNLEEFIEKRINEYEHEEQGEIIYFEKIIKYLGELESHKETLALQYLTKLALELIPYNLRKEGYDKPRKFKAEELVKGDKLVLKYNVGYSYRNNVSALLKLMNVILKGINPATVQEYDKDIYFKYYKNYKLDIKLNKDDALKIAKFLEENQEDLK